MHEAGLIAEALTDALRRGPRGGDLARAPVALEAVVTDPVRVSAAALGLHLEIALRQMGLAQVPVRIDVRGVACPTCGTANRPDPGRPFCEACGWPLPGQPGSGVRIKARW